MEITGSFVLQAPLESAWGFMLDMERVGRCMPGVETVEAINDETYRGTLKVRVGPITASFSGTAALTEVEPQKRLVASIEAEDKASASSVKANFTSSLTPVEQGTRVDYSLDITLRGRLAQFGAPVFRAVAKRTTDEFVACLQESMAAG